MARIGSYSSQHHFHLPRLVAQMLSMLFSYTCLCICEGVRSEIRPNGEQTGHLASYVCGKFLHTPTCHALSPCACFAQNILRPTRPEEIFPEGVFHSDAGYWASGPESFAYNDLMLGASLSLEDPWSSQAPSFESHWCAYQDAYCPGFASSSKPRERELLPSGLLDSPVGSPSHGPQSMPDRFAKTRESLVVCPAQFLAYGFSGFM